MGMEFAADPETLSRLGDLSSLEVFVPPVGPGFTGVDTPAKLLVAAVTIIPQGRAEGDTPDTSAFFSAPSHPLIVY